MKPKLNALFDPHKVKKSHIALMKHSSPKRNRAKTQLQTMDSAKVAKIKIKYKESLPDIQSQTIIHKGRKTFKNAKNETLPDLRKMTIEQSNVSQELRRQFYFDQSQSFDGRKPSPRPNDATLPRNMSKKYLHSQAVKEFYQVANPLGYPDLV